MENLNQNSRAVVLLCAYDSVVLHFTLKALEKTLSENETVVIVLNGKNGVRATLVEKMVRNWAANNPNRHVVRPISAGKMAYDAIKDTLVDFEPLKNKEFICKIDDDLIPLKSGWLDRLHETYLQQTTNGEKIGFVTSLINNNAWGFAQLVPLFDKWQEYRNIMNINSISGEGRLPAGEIADGLNGTIWQYPWVARWCHQWTLLNLPEYLEKTKDLNVVEIPLETHYSIGCIFFRKELWAQIEPMDTNKARFDERMLHLYCEKNQLRKFSLMREPMGHLYYFVQRKANADLIPDFAQSFADFWHDDSFLDYPKYDVDMQMAIRFEELESTLPQANFSFFKAQMARLPAILKNKFKRK